MTSGCTIHVKRGPAATGLTQRQAVMHMCAMDCVPLAVGHPPGEKTDTGSLSPSRASMGLATSSMNCQRGVWDLMAGLGLMVGVAILAQEVGTSMRFRCFTASSTAAWFLATTCAQDPGHGPLCYIAIYLGSKFFLDVWEAFLDVWETFLFEECVASLTTSQQLLLHMTTDHWCFNPPAAPTSGPFLP